MRRAEIMEENILSFNNVTVEFDLYDRILTAVNGVTLSVKKGEIIGIVGESGSGKSTLASTVLNIVNPPGKISGGQVVFKGTDILTFDKKKLNDYRWKNVAYVFQAAQNSLNPVLTIKEIFMETIKSHIKNADEAEWEEKIKKLFGYVRLDADQVVGSYPHQLSGGMKQRVIIALSLILDPAILVLDEPTTALDVVTQAYIMNILKDIHKELNITMIFLTHDIAVVAKIADRMAVMYGGKIVESGTVDEIFYESVHPYTRGLIHAAPSLVDDVTKRKAIPGIPPDLTIKDDSCRFFPRCALAKKGRCDGKGLKNTEISTGHEVYCKFKKREETDD